MTLPREKYPVTLPAAPERVLDTAEAAFMNSDRWTTLLLETIVRAAASRAMNTIQFMM